MNYFTKTRLLTWLLIILVVINISALATFGYFFFSKPGVNAKPAGNAKQAFREALSLSPSQSGVVDSINAIYQERTGPVVRAIREKRSLLMEALIEEKQNMDSLYKMAAEIGDLQTDLQKANIVQYLQLKKVCTPEQLEKLSNIYSELYGCCRSGQGKGKMHRNRYGQGRPECGANGEQ